MHKCMDNMWRLLRRASGRRDDLWSWFYMVVEMLEGGLPWRAKTGSPPGVGAGGGSAMGGSSAGNSAASEEHPKALAQRMKQAALEDVERLSPSRRLPGTWNAPPSPPANFSLIPGGQDCPAVAHARHVESASMLYVASAVFADKF